MNDDRISFLINDLQEGLDVEVKNWLGGIQDNESKAILAKEIIALANSGGGYIFIGFDDGGEGHPEIVPADDELASFTQDAVAAVVERYVTPPCQCSLGLYTRSGSDIKHPVISVPGEHRIPVWAKRASPDERTLRSGTVYLRRPGGSSEPARNQDDWEKLLERLVRARQADQMNAIREIMTPSQSIEQDTPNLEEWYEESHRLWTDLIEPLPEGDARKLSEGYWTLAFDVAITQQPTLAELNQFLERETPRYSGWQPFTYLHREVGRPTPHGGEIRAWLAHSHDTNELIEDGGHADFWRISLDGKGFSLRPMQEDRDSYLSNRTPRPQGSFFDWTLSIYRMAEFLKFIEAFALKFSDENAQFSVLLRYSGTKGRTLQQHDFKYNLRDGGQCADGQIEARKSGSVSEISLNLEEVIFSLLSPVYQQFGFTELPKALVDNVVRDALNYG